MKQLKLDHELAQLVLSGKKSSTWRLYDDKDLSVNDKLELVDKVDKNNPSTWKVIGTATINIIIEKRLGDITDADMDGREKFGSSQEMLATYREYYGQDVNLDTPVKIVHFEFSKENSSYKPTEILPRITQATIYADGGSRGNPGPSASGYVIYDENKNMVVNRGIYLGITTNNQAEYTALKLALEEAINLGAKEVSVFMDSLLVINQMKGIFKVKNRDLWPIHDSIKQLCNKFNQVNFTQVPRELNKLADAAVNKALDEKLDNQSVSATNISK